MADIITFPCEYLVFSAGYEDRLATKLPEVTDFCIENGTISLFIKNNQSIRPLVINNNGVFDLTRTPSQRFIDQTLIRNELGNEPYIILLMLFLLAFMYESSILAILSLFHLMMSKISFILFMEPSLDNLPLNKKKSI